MMMPNSSDPLRSSVSQEGRDKDRDVPSVGWGWLVGMGLGSGFQSLREAALSRLSRKTKGESFWLENQELLLPVSERLGPACLPLGEAGFGPVHLLF